MKIIPNSINGEIFVPSSKSVLHRLIILASLANEPTTIYCNNYGNDIKRTIDCIVALGGKVTINNDNIIVYPITNPTDNAVLNVGESGSTLRFMLPVVVSLGISATFTGDSGIINRPLKPILDLFKDKGISVSSDKLPLKVSGKLTSGDYVIDGSLSSQFATGMLIALANLGGNSTLKIENATSNDYINITTDCLKMFGVNVTKKDKYYIDKCSIKSACNITCEGDWSSACFIVALGVLCGKVTLKNLNINSCQGDKIIIDLIEKMGGNIKVDKDCIICTKSKLKGVEFSIKDCPDIAPILAVIMAKAEGKSVLHDVDRLKIKESDRLVNIIELLTSLGINVEYSSDTLTIYGGEFNSADLLGKNDHRIAISSIVALTLVGGNFDGIECIDKSYPTFLSDYKSLGGYYE